MKLTLTSCDDDIPKLPTTGTEASTHACTLFEKRTFVEVLFDEYHLLLLS